jgi:hypothetical protein
MQISLKYDTSLSAIPQFPSEANKKMMTRRLSYASDCLKYCGVNGDTYCCFSDRHATHSTHSFYFALIAYAHDGEAIWRAGFSGVADELREQA